MSPDKITNQLGCAWLYLPSNSLVFLDGGAHCAIDVGDAGLEQRLQLPKHRGPLQRVHPCLVSRNLHHDLPSIKAVLKQQHEQHQECSTTDSTMLVFQHEAYSEQLTGGLSAIGTSGSGLGTGAGS